MSKEKNENEEGRKECSIKKYLDANAGNYEKEVIFMLEKKYGGVKRTDEEWKVELSVFLNKSVNF